MFGDAKKFSYPYPMTPKRLLFVDDDDIQNFILESFIEQIPDAEAEVMDNARKALDKLLACANSQPGELPHLLFLDLNMPEVNGFEFLDILQEQMKQEYWPTIIILTSSINRRDLDRVSSYPCVRELLVKPLTLDILQKKIEEHCPREAN